MLMLASAIVMNAQSLTGKQWCTILTSEDGVDVAVALTFDKNGSCELVVAAEHEMKVDGVPGAYTLNGKDLKLNLNRGKAEVDVDYEVKGMDAKSKAAMDKQIRPELNDFKKDFKLTMLDGMPKMNNMKIVSLESKRLILKDDDGDEIPFYAE